MLISSVRPCSKEELSNGYLYFSEDPLDAYNPLPPGAIGFSAGPDGIWYYGQPPVDMEGGNPNGLDSSQSPTSKKATLTIEPTISLYHEAWNLNSPLTPFLASPRDSFTLEKRRFPPQDIALPKASNNKPHILIETCRKEKRKLKRRVILSDSEDSEYEQLPKKPKIQAKIGKPREILDGTAQEATDWGHTYYMWMPRGNHLLYWLNWGGDCPNPITKASLVQYVANNTPGKTVKDVRNLVTHNEKNALKRFIRDKEMGDEGRRIMRYRQKHSMTYDATGKLAQWLPWPTTPDRVRRPLPAAL